MLPWNAEDLTFDETRFRGKARLFPLPNLVLYPHVMQPLNIFEPRYLEMLNESLDSDGLIALGILSPGYEKNYEGRPEVLPHVCIGKIVTHQRQEDGRYNVLLLGMRRARITSELPPDRSFREIEVELLDDYCLTENDSERTELQTALTQRFQECLPEEHSANPSLSEMLSTEIPLNVLTDLVSFAMPLQFDIKCALLSESNVDLRAWKLLEAMESLPAEIAENDFPNGYPPPFSEN